MTIEVEAPDGSIHEFPDETKEDVIKKVMADYVKGPDAKKFSSYMGKQGDKETSSPLENSVPFPKGSPEEKERDSFRNQVKRAIFVQPGEEEEFKPGISGVKQAFADIPKEMGREGSNALRSMGQDIKQGKYAMAGLDALGYVMSPVTGAATSIVGRPVEAATGVKREIPGAVASAMVPMGEAEDANALRAMTREPPGPSAGDIDLLRKEGVQLTPGQMAGKQADILEQKATSVPITGPAIAAARRRSVQQFNKAAINRSLAPIGDKLPDEVAAGTPSLAYAERKLNDVYDRTLAKTTAVYDFRLKSEISDIRDAVKKLPAAQQGEFDRIVQAEVLDRFSTVPRNRGKFTKGQQIASGETYKQMESTLGSLAAKMAGSESYDTRSLGRALREVQSSLKSMRDRVNPEVSDQLKASDQGWANFKRVQRAVVKAGRKDGIFSPGELMQSIKDLDKSKDKSDFARGGGVMRDLADAGSRVLASTVPDSGTAGRYLTFGAIPELAAHPHVAVGLGAAALPYTPAGINLLNKFATISPRVRNYLANAAQRTSPFTRHTIAPINALNMLTQPQQQ